MKNKNPDTRPDKKALNERIARQVTISAAGEIVAFSLAIGAVYVSERMLPKQTEAFVLKLAEQMAKWRGTSIESQKLYAKKILDVGIMNMAGLTGMATQFGIRRANQKNEEKTSAWYEAGRLVTGRFAGTLTAIGALALIETCLPGFMRKTEAGLSKTTGMSHRFSELVLSNTVQTVGAIAGNAPAQLLYDNVVNPPKKGVTP